MIFLEALFEGIAIIFDIVALIFILFAGSHLLYKFFKTPKIKGTYSLSDKDYHILRSRFVHRVILSLDLFLAGDMIKLAFATSSTVLVQILLIVIIRTILSYFLLKEIKHRR